MNKTQQLLKEREEEFDKEFDWAISQNSRFNEVETYIKSFHATTISLLLNSIKEEISKLPVDLVNTKFNKDDKDEFVDAIRVSDIDALLSETISTLTNSNEKM